MNKPSSAETTPRPAHAALGELSVTEFMARLDGRLDEQEKMLKSALGQYGKRIDALEKARETDIERDADHEGKVLIAIARNEREMGLVKRAKNRGRLQATVAGSVPLLVGIVHIIQLLLKHGG